LRGAPRHHRPVGHRLVGLYGLRLRSGSPATPDAAEGIHAVGDVARLHTNIWEWQSCWRTAPTPPNKAAAVT
jgi:hypothetical protein